VRRGDWYGDEVGFGAGDGVELVEGAFGEDGDGGIFILEVEMLHDKFLDDGHRRLLGLVRFAAEEVLLLL
jgi:hypothetical protein